MKINVIPIIKTLETTPHDDTLYLINALSDISGIFSLNGNAVYLVKNIENCSALNIQTEYLKLSTNVHISAFPSNSVTFETGYYNCIELQILDNSENEENLSAFVNLCNSHATYLDGKDFVSFFDSLVSLFQLPIEQNYKNLVGLFGELSIIKFFYENCKKDLSRYWHTTGSSSKLDFVSPRVNIEVKTTKSEQLMFTINHEQLFDNPNDTYLAAVLISENNSGITLNELIEDLLQDLNYCNDLSFSVKLETERRRVSPNEANSKRFILKNIKLYNSKEICPFTNIPETISELTYKINLSGFKSEDVTVVGNFICRM